MISAKKIIARAISLSVLAVSLTVTALPASAGRLLLDASFESGLDGFSARGSESVSRTSSAACDGQYSLLVSDRSSAWNGAAVALGSNWVSGETYSFSCAVLQSSGEAVTMQLSLQYSDASGETNYRQIAAGNVGSDTWTFLENTAYTIPADASNRYLYIETTESLCDFCVDAVTSSLPTVYRLGDVNCDEAIDGRDISDLLAFLQGQDADVSLNTADMNGDGKLNAIDLSMLRQYFNYPELTKTTTTTTITTTTTTQVSLKPGQWNNTADISWIDPAKPTVALCFDDGPVGIGGSTSAQRIHDALTNSGFHATFFYWGNRINSANENEIVQAKNRGFEIANHTYTHPYLTNLSADGILSEYNQCAAILTRLTGQTDFLVRPPYLAVNDLVKSTLPVPLINCGVDSADWNGASTNDIVNTIKTWMGNNRLNGQVVLMHETYNTTAEAMEILCPYFKENGWQVVTVSEMFKVNGKDMYAGNVYNNCW